MADVLVKALSLNPADRYQSADEMKIALLDLPRLDSRRRRYVMYNVIHFSVIIIAAVVGLGLFRAGRSMENRVREMSELTTSAQTAWQDGDYTKAYESVFGSLEKRFLDPGCAPETLRTAAEILGVYDYSNGFSPAYSVGQSGEPLFCTVTPGGTRFAVLTEEAVGLSATTRLLRILDAQTGAACAQPIEVSQNAVPRVEFLDEDTFLYVNQTGALALRRLDEETDMAATSNDVRRFTLSADRTVVAFLRGDSAEELIAYVFLMTDYSHFSPGKNITLDTKEFVFFQDETDVNNCLFALNQDGSRLAVSLVDKKFDSWYPKGLLRIYSFPSLGEPDNAPWEDFPQEHPYACYEGGFFGDYLCFAGWTERENDCLSIISVYDLKDSAGSTPRDPLITRPLFEQVHASVDENGIYVSQGSSLACINPDPLNWIPLPSTGGSVNVLQHTAEHVLAVTDSGEAYICESDGSGQHRAFTCSAQPCAALSNQYLLFCDRSKLSVQEWENRTETVPSRIEYDADYAHLLFNVTADKSSAMLYGGVDLFRVYGSDGSLKGNGTTDTGVRNLKYLREPEQGTEPKQECLRVEYPDRSVYYAAADGSFLAEGGLVRNTGSIQTEDYLLSYQADGVIRIYERGKQDLLQSIATESRLVDAFQADGKDEYLLISLLSEDNQPSALLLNRDLEVIANLPGAFTVLADGTLYYDDRAGVLLEGTIYDRDALAKVAERACAPHWRGWTFHEAEAEN